MVKHQFCWNYILEQVEDSTYTTKKYTFSFTERWANDERTMSEGWAKESRRAGAAEYVTNESRRAGAAEYVTKESRRAGAAEYVTNDNYTSLSADQKSSSLKPTK